MDIKLNIALDADEIRAEAEKKFKEKTKELIQTKLSILFHDPKNQGNFIQHLHGKDPDLSFAFNEISGILTEMVLEEKMKEYAQDYIKRHFQKHLDEALDKAMQHKANAIAFKLTKEQKWWYSKRTHCTFISALL